MTTILVIEDEQAIREEVVDILAFEGFDVVEAADGAAGVELAREHRPGLILSDIMMPHLDGYGVLRQLQHDRPTATIPFIFLTAKVDKEDLRRGMGSGADDYLTKPFTREELLTAVQMRLDKHAVVQEESEQNLDSLRQAIAAHLPHELRTPLICILGYGDLLQDDPGSFTADEITEMGRAIVESGERLHRLIENYLLFASIQSLATDRAKIAGLTRATTLLPGEAIQCTAAPIAAGYHRCADLILDVVNVPVAISDDYLKKIVYEIVDNAFKFSPAESRVKVVSRIENQFLVFSVRDCGRGIHPDEIPAIGAYRQFNRNHYEQQGVGLGLAIAKRLVELHAGSMTVESTPEQGTTIRVALPLAQD